MRARGFSFQARLTDGAAIWHTLRAWTAPTQNLLAKQPSVEPNQ